MENFNFKPHFAIFQIFVNIEIFSNFSKYFAKNNENVRSAAGEFIKYLNNKALKISEFYENFRKPFQMQVPIKISWNIQYI